MANLLAAEVYSHITKGGVLKSHRRETIQSGRLSDLEYLKLALDSKLNSNYSAQIQNNPSLHLQGYCRCLKWQ